MEALTVAVLPAQIRAQLEPELPEWVEARWWQGPEDMMALQMDQKNLYAAEFLDGMMAAVEGETDEYNDLFEMMKKWDQVDSKDQAAPLVFHKWMKQLPKTMLAKDFPDDPMQVPHRVVACWGRKP